METEKMDVYFPKCVNDSRRNGKLGFEINRKSTHTNTNTSKFEHTHL